MIARRQHQETVVTSCAHLVSFGFPAVFTRLWLDTSGPVYLNFQSSDGTTGGFPFSSGDSPFDLDDGWPIGGLSLMATSTGLSVRVFALGR